MNGQTAEDYIERLCEMFGRPDNLSIKRVNDEYYNFFKAMPEFMADVVIAGVRKNNTFFPKIAELEKYKPSVQTGASVQFEIPINQTRCEYCNNEGWAFYCKHEPLIGGWAENTCTCVCEAGAAREVWFKTNWKPPYSMPTLSQIQERVRLDGSNYRFGRWWDFDIPQEWVSEAEAKRLVQSGQILRGVD